MAISTGRIAENRRARHDYQIEETLEAGIILHGSEVKSLRTGRASIAESYAGDNNGRLALFNANIPVYPASRDNHSQSGCANYWSAKSNVTAYLA